MEKGKLCVCTHRPTSEQAGYRRLQYRENGANVSRHVTAAEIPALQEAIDGYHRFQELVQQYAQLMVDKTRAERAADSKKKVGRWKINWEGYSRCDAI